MKRKNYNKYGEYIGKKIITKKQIEKQVAWLSWGEFIFSLVITVLLVPLLIVTLPVSINGYKQVIANADRLLKFQLIGQKAIYIINLIIAIGVIAVSLYVTIRYLIKAIRMKNGGFFVDIDDVNYLDVVLRGNRRHQREYLVIYFYKYGRYETTYTFDNTFAEHKEKFYVVVSKDEPKKIINIYRFSKFEIQE